jgi:hypothetical protein
MVERDGRARAYHMPKVTLNNIVDRINGDAIYSDCLQRCSVFSWAESSSDTHSSNLVVARIQAEVVGQIQSMQLRILSGRSVSSVL